MANVIVGCKLIHGLSLVLDEKTIHLNGQNSNESLIASKFGQGFTGECGYTSLDESLWEKLAEKYKKFYPFKEGFVFAVKNAASAKAASKERKHLTTGAEQITVNPDQVFKM